MKKKRKQKVNEGALQPEIKEAQTKKKKVIVAVGKATKLLWDNLPVIIRVVQALNGFPHGHHDPPP